MDNKLNPFLGLKRKRLPGMNMIAACEGGAPIRDAFAAYFFMKCHKEIKPEYHECIIEKALKEQEEQIRQTTSSVKSPNNTMLPRVLGLVELDSLIAEEWSYLDEKETFIFYKMADMAIKEVPRWIAKGSYIPSELPMLGGEIVQRPLWVKKYFGNPDSKERRRFSDYINKLLAEIYTVA